VGVCRRERRVNRRENTNAKKTWVREGEKERERRDKEKRKRDVWEGERKGETTFQKTALHMPNKQHTKTSKYEK
jgi:hypothetical protein